MTNPKQVTVQELIDLLMTFPPNATVMEADCYNGELDVFTLRQIREDGDYVVIRPTISAHWGNA